MASKASNKSVWVVANTSWNLYNFRRPLICELIARGYTVTAHSPTDEFVPRLITLGVRHIHLELDNSGINPIREGLTVLRLVALFGRESPALLLTFTPKPNIYCSIAATLLGIPVVANVAGLGRAFVDKGWLRIVSKALYRIALHHPAKVFFQNEEDRSLFHSESLVTLEKTQRLPGSGVDLSRFSPAPYPANPSPIFLLIARLLRDKGVGEFVEAARLVKGRHPNARFQLLGPLGVVNPSAIFLEQVEAWVREGIVEYLGETDDVVPYIAAVDCVVLPSYYGEGVPRTLLEAAATARPVITTDHVGCRDAVDDGATGMLCKIRDSVDLAERMERMIAMPRLQRAEMGRRGREKMEREFDERFVVSSYLTVVNEIIAGRA